VPESRPLLDPAVLARLMAQQLSTPLPMEGSVSGLHKSPHRGSSVEFAEYRNYAPGDDIRRLDWRVFGRTDRFYMKEFEAETNLRAYFVLDCSGSMNFGEGENTKLRLAQRMIATLAYLLVNQGDAAGLINAAEKTIKELPPRRNPAHLQTIMETLEKTKASNTTGLTGALHELAEKVRQRALVLIFSDLFTEPEEMLSCIQHLRYRKHDVAVFHILDRAELEFKFDRPVRFVDLESSFTLITEPSMIRDEYLRQFGIFLEHVKRGCREFKASYRQVVTDQDYERTLADFLVERARASAAGAV